MVVRCAICWAPRLTLLTRLPVAVDHITIWRGLVEEKIVPAEDANLLPF